MKTQTETDVHQIYREIFEDKSEVFNYEKLRTKVEQIKEKERSKMETLALFLKSQIENFDNTSAHIDSNLQNIDKLQKQIVILKTLSKGNKPTVNVDTGKLNQLLQIKKNISLVIDRLGDFLNVTDKLNEMENLITDESNFIIIQQKLENLINLEHMMLESGGNKAELNQFVQKFEEVHTFQERFFSKVTSIFDKYLRAAKANPQILKNAIDIMEMNDKVTNSNKYTKLMLAHLQEAVFQRFEEKLAGKTEVLLILENINFCVDDLLNIFELIVPLFPERYNIFEFFEEKYKEQIQKRILPFLKDFESLKKDPGNLVYLFNWLGSYEKLLTKVGFTMVDFNNLRDEIKKSMPIFFDHLSNLLRAFLLRIASNDDFLFQPNPRIEEYRTSLPDDIAKFLNEQIDFLSTQIQGEMFCNLFRNWMDQIGSFIADHVN